MPSHINQRSRRALHVYSVIEENILGCPVLSVIFGVQQELRGSWLHMIKTSSAYFLDEFRWVRDE
jgi:hypothetical protein